MTRFGGPERKRVFVCRHPRSCPESTKSTEVYLHSNTTIKQEAIDKIAPIDTPPGRYKPSDKLLAFLESL